MNSTIRSKTLLIVDDDALTLRALTRMMAKSGMQVLSAKSLHEAKPILESDTVDVLLTDLKLEQGEGTDLIGLAQSQSLKTRCILMSGSCGQEAERLAFQLGAMDLLEKPFQEEDLLSAIKRALDPRDGFSGELSYISLVDILNMYHVGRRSMVIELAGPKVMQIHMEHGQVVHALCGSAAGETAFRQILSTTRGRLRTALLEKITQRTIARRFDALLLDALRASDDDRRTVLTNKMRELRFGQS